jgi:hypothetical protein
MVPYYARPADAGITGLGCFASWNMGDVGRVTGERVRGDAISQVPAIDSGWMPGGLLFLAAKRRTPSEIALAGGVVAVVLSSVAAVDVCPRHASAEDRC